MNDWSHRVWTRGVFAAAKAAGIQTPIVVHMLPEDPLPVHSGLVRMPLSVEFDTAYEYMETRDGITEQVMLVIGPKSVELLAKLDTGAANCIFERRYAEMLGLDVESGREAFLGCPEIRASPRNVGCAITFSDFKLGHQCALIQPIQIPPGSNGTEARTTIANFWFDIGYSYAAWTCRTIFDVCKRASSISR